MSELSDNFIGLTVPNSIYDEQGMSMLEYVGRMKQDYANRVQEHNEDPTAHGGLNGVEASTALSLKNPFDIEIMDATGAHIGAPCATDGSETVRPKLPAILDAQITGKSATADKLTTAKQITISDNSGIHSGVASSFDGSQNTAIKLPTTSDMNVTGNAGSATKLQTGRTLSIVDASVVHQGAPAQFTGEANINIPLPSVISADITGKSANADQADKLKTPRTIFGQQFDGSANVSGTIPVASGGTGATTGAGIVDLLEGFDGSGSGIDADTLDGKHGGAFPEMVVFSGEISTVAETPTMFEMTFQNGCYMIYTFGITSGSIHLLFSRTTSAPFLKQIYNEGMVTVAYYYDSATGKRYISLLGSVSSIRYRIVRFN